MALLVQPPRWSQETRLADLPTADGHVQASATSNRAWLGQDGKQVVMERKSWYRAFDGGRRRMMRGAAASGILAVWKRAAPRNRMREILTSGSVGGLAEQSLALPGRFLVTRRVSEGVSRVHCVPRLPVGLPFSEEI